MKNSGKIRIELRGVSVEIPFNCQDCLNELYKIQRAIENNEPVIISLTLMNFEYHIHKDIV